MSQLIRNCQIILCYTGVRQGENLSPLLFSFHLNHIDGYLLENNCNHFKFDNRWLDEMLKVLVLMYTDDTVITANSEIGLCTQGRGGIL